MTSDLGFNGTGRRQPDWPDSNQCSLGIQECPVTSMHWKMGLKITKLKSTLQRCEQGFVSVGASDDDGPPCGALDSTVRSPGPSLLELC